MQDLMFLSMSRGRLSLAYAVLAGILIISFGVFWHEPLRQSIDQVKDFDLAAGYRYVTGSEKYDTQDLAYSAMPASDEGASLAALCNSGTRPWNPNIIIDCPVLQGGFGNVRLDLLTCLRYALEAKVAFRLPYVSRRNAKDVSDFRTSDYVTLDYLINQDFFITQLLRQCPELVVHPAGYEVPALRSFGSVRPSMDVGMDTYVAPGQPPWHGVLTAPQQWPDLMDAWIAGHTDESPPSSQSPIAFRIDSITWGWPTRLDPHEFARHFSELVRPRNDIKFLAAAALIEMRNKFGAHISFRAPEKPYVKDNAFIGIHLRVEKDATDFGWLSYDEQASYIVERLTQHHDDTALPDVDKTVIYVASGELEGIERLAADLNPIPVVTKFDLLQPDTLAGAVLRSMTWDQQALVDMLVLEHSGYFIGVRDSTFSWHLALRRAAAVNHVIGEYPENCWIDDADGSRRTGCEKMLADNEEWRDDLSTLIGNGHERLEPSVVQVLWP